MACDGHTYERAAIEAWLSASPTSPKTGEVLESTTLIPNHSVRQLIDAFQQAATDACGADETKAPPRRARTMSKASALYVLHEAASGYALLDVVELDEVASLTPELLAAIADADAFKRICKLKAFIAFNSAEQALENINAIAEHSVPDRLKSFLETNLPPVSSKKKLKGPAFSLGVVEPDLGKAIAEATGAHCRSDDVVRELLRGARQHLTKFVPELQNNLLEQAQVGLGHAFSRCKVKAPS